MKKEHKWILIGIGIVCAIVLIWWINKRKKEKYEHPVYSEFSQKSQNELVNDMRKEPASLNEDYFSAITELGLRTVKEMKETGTLVPTSLEDLSFKEKRDVIDTIPDKYKGSIER